MKYSNSLILNRLGSFIMQFYRRSNVRDNQWTEEQHKYLARLSSQSSKNNWKQWAKDMSVHFGTPFNREQVRMYWRLNIRNTTIPVTPEYKEEIEILANGSVKSDKLVELSLEQSKDPQYLLEAHGFCPNEFELLNAKSSQWNHSNKEHGTSVSYASKITVKPKKQGLDFEELSKRINSLVEPFWTESETLDISNRHLVIPLFDLHFGVNDVDDYQSSQDEILATLEYNYKEVLIVLGGDFFHSDNFKSTTTRGTQLDTVNIPDAWEQGGLYIEPIIQKALETSQGVRIAYLKGNHAETLDWTFTKYLEAKYPQADVDARVKERKCYMVGSNAILLHHGDKQSKTKSLTELFASEFPIEWSKAKHREVLTGHKHFEQVVNHGGLVHRQVPTRAKTDGWHEDNGYTTSNKTFHLYEYAEEGIKTIYYV